MHALPDTPWPLFDQWLQEAGPTEPRVPEAMQVATADATGLPNLRTVLLKGVGPDGLVFFTNYDSPKAHELAANPRAAFLLHFKGLERQIRGQGDVLRVSSAESDAYFATRARGSQLGAWASPQSRMIDGREALLAAFDALDRDHAGRDVPRPPFWGGYRIVPRNIEFWQGREDRLHDRWLYTLTGEGWTTTRLAP